MSATGDDTAREEVRSSRISMEEAAVFRDKRKRRTLMLAMLAFGVVSYCSAMVTEAQRSVAGQYLWLLGADALKVCAATGCASLAGCATNAVLALVADVTGAHWWFVFGGYLLLSALALLGLVPGWGIAMLLLIAERLGKAIRTPSRDTILTQVRHSVGRRIGIGSRQALDQTGAITGALCFTVVLLIMGEAKRDDSIRGYRLGFLLLFVPMGILFAALGVARFLLGPHPERASIVNFREIEMSNTSASASASAGGGGASSQQQPPSTSSTSELPIVSVLPPQQYTRVPLKARLLQFFANLKGLGVFFWLYSAFSALNALGAVPFPLIGYHLVTHDVLDPFQVPAAFAGTLLVTALASVFVGWAHERTGFALLLLLSPVLAFAVPFLVFVPTSSSSSALALSLALIGIALWGASTGVRETTMRAAVADLTDIVGHGLGYGVYELATGAGLLIGAVIMGALYKVHDVTGGGNTDDNNNNVGGLTWGSYLAICGFCCGTQLASMTVWVALQVQQGCTIVPCCGSCMLRS